MTTAKIAVTPVAPANSHAVVLGGSVAGLLAARVLSRHFSKVTLIERDRYPAQPLPRNGVPQARHVHVMLLRGLRILEDLLPGATAEMESLGAGRIDSSAGFHWLTPGGYAPRFDAALPFLAISRPLIDWVIRRRIQSLRNVEMIESVDALSLTQSEGKAIDGVRLRHRDGQTLDTLPAALVVDATGRGSRTPELMKALGLPSPAETIVNGHCGYASRLYRREPGLPRAYQAVFSQAAPPKVNRQGLAFPIEGDRWIVTLAGGGADYPPVREDHFLDFAQSLPDPEVYNLIRHSQPLGPIHGARFDGNRRVHYERIAMPGGLLVLGDAACAFNPVYGQGMTSAAIGAQILDHCLAAGDTSDFQQRLAKAIEPAWMLATSEDFRYPGATGATAAPATKWIHAYLDRVIARSCVHHPTRRILMEVFHMLRGPQALLRPSIVYGAFAGRRGSGHPPPVAAQPAPASTADLFAATRFGAE